MTRKKSKIALFCSFYIAKIAEYCSRITCYEIVRYAQDDKPKTIEKKLPIYGHTLLSYINGNYFISQPYPFRPILHQLTNHYYRYRRSDPSIWQ